ncbi:invasion protein regulator [Ruegeria denitrificans]|uniref:Invasion protein regulator n=1 Tax=Ruegeria denitrificans TaxID=1715692 RepID=A0A0P1I8D7_9RHOB|nr:adenylate/guanylate cyclase domain-containing protein [Ruegeria denitrificans]CUJ97645.1 invasion protein regulator [Ruegeria denitrificans]
MERRLAAILAADVVGYSGLVSQNETATLHALKDTLEALRSRLEKHNGRIVKTMGDGFLAEFQSVVNSVSCADELQKYCADRNRETQNEPNLVFRMGIHMGDVVFDGEDILGDGVNTAARLEKLAGPGCVAISGRVRDEISGRLDLTFRDLGKQQLKNLPRPVRVYELASDLDYVDLPRNAPQTNKNSIAVLPFDNMSDDPDQIYFSDGISEDIITDLSKIRELFVIARNSSFSYKGRSVDVRQIARELDVQFIVEGSVRKAGNRARVTAQLIDAQSGGHVWAERYDRELTDIFAVQDEITEKIVKALQLALAEDAMGRSNGSRTSNLQAYDLYLQGRLAFHSHVRRKFVEARSLFERAIECDPQFAQAYCGLADCNLMIYCQYDGEEEHLISATVAADRALELAPNLAEAYASKGLALAQSKDQNGANTAFRKASELDSNLYQAQYYWARHCWENSDFEKAARHFEQAWKISPRDPQAPFLLMAVYGKLGREEDVLKAARATLETARCKLEVEPGNSRACFQCAHALAHIGRSNDAEEMIRRAIDLDPGDRIVVYNAACMFATIGRVDQALDTLENMPGHQLQMLDWIRNDGDLDNLRDHPRFQKFMAALEAQEDTKGQNSSVH